MIARRAAHTYATLLGFWVITGAGCDNAASLEGERSKRSVDKPRIALVMKSLANEFFSTMANGAKKHHEQQADDYDLIVNGIKDERDLARQVGLVEEIIGGVDAIVIAPADSKALVRVCKRAMDEGIVVVNIDNKMDDQVLEDVGVQIPFVGPDNRAGARMVGEYLAKQLQRGDKVAILEGVPTAFNSQQRKLGFEDAMNAAGMDIVDSQSGQWEINIANRIASAMLSEHDELKAILCSNDSMALGALAAVKEAGRAGEVYLVGFDNISAIQHAIRAQEVLATADQHADQLAVYGIEYALQILREKSTPTNKQTAVDLVTTETLR
jgi:ribose transport system substrate-binding protein